ncbi:MAG TPA: ATP-binding protein, partial [Casimicrobiaceae bacterium]|nr:ATP-binding protein [Casimicrobiaceae bacterium]
GAGSGADGGRVGRWLRRLSAGDDAAAAESTEVTELRRELISTRDYLQSLIEDQDAANEELKSANEEILSTNEELQSTNEELETAKEELQSVNEELTTVNEQLQTRNAELSRLNDDVTNLITSTSLPMVAVGVDLRIRRVTPAAATLFNILPSDIGRPIGNLKPAVDVAELEALIVQVIDTVKASERPVVDREGRQHLLRVHPYRTADNKIDGAVLVLFDIEEITAQASRLREKASLLDLSLDAIIVRDRDSVVTFWNQGAELTYGWKANEATGKNSHALLQDDAMASGAEIDAMLRSQGHWQGEITHRRRDGTEIVVESRQVVHRTPGGGILAILQIDRDVTDRKRMIDELAAADRAKNDFLATLGHELRNPLTPIRNGMEVLRMLGGQAPEMIEVRESIERNVRRMTRLIDDLLDVARITHGHIDLRKENVDIGGVIREIAGELRSMADSAGDTVAIRLPSEPVIVDADPVRLAQIIENLLHNAIKYTDGGRIDVVLTTEDREVVLRIRDSGVGIAKENLTRIWEPFVQGDSSRESRRSGLGLGLTLVRDLVGLHAGTISGASDGQGKGSEFVMRLPLARQQTLAAASPRPRAALQGRRIMIVDDNHDAVASFAALLKMMDNDVRTATSGPEALRVALQYRPEIVLLDIGLPGMNGYDVARALRQQLGDGGTVIVAVSGYGAEQDRRQSTEAGFDAHFVKPMAIDELQAFLGSREND